MSSAAPAQKLQPPRVDHRTLAQKTKQLRQEIQQLADNGPILVAYSGGCDSSLLLAVCHAEVGNNCQAVMAVSPSLAYHGQQRARTFCAARGIRLHEVQTDEFEQEAYRRNDGERCFECKAALFRAMDAVARHHSQEAEQQDDQAKPHLLLGTVVEDLGDHRPGLRAAAEAGARGPLAEVGLRKDEVRALAHELDLPTWDLPAEPCLSSRVPYGQRIDPVGLRMIEHAEAVVRASGMRDCRMRHHTIGDGRGLLARIEVPTDQLAQALEARTTWIERLREIGYAEVTLDLAGLRSGGGNALLRGDEVQAATAPTPSEES